MSEKLPVDGFEWIEDISERMKVNKCKKLVCNLYDKKRLC